MTLKFSIEKPGTPRDLIYDLLCFFNDPILISDDIGNNNLFHRFDISFHIVEIRSTGWGSGEKKLFCLRF